jgi:hypothetical protein
MWDFDPRRRVPRRFPYFSAGREGPLIPDREQDPAMPTTTTQIPDLSVDFMSWLNAELRRHIEGPEESEEKKSEKTGLVNRLKAYITRD